MAGMTSHRLANDLAVFSGHFQELSDSHLTLGDSFGVLPARLGHAGVQAPRRDTRLGR